MQMLVKANENQGSAKIGRAALKRRRTPTARQVFLSPLSSNEAEQEILERTFFSSIRLRNGTYKYTYSHRLDDLNELVNQLLPESRPLRIMDVAVSSGISTLEWVGELERSRIEHEMVAGDLSINAFLLSIGKHLHVLADETGYIFQFEVFGKAIPSPPWRRHLVRYFLPLWLLRRALTADLNIIRNDNAKAIGHSTTLSSGNSFRRLALVSPRLPLHADLRVVEDDILADTTTLRGFHVVRAANILNKAYFDQQTLVRMSVNLRQRLMPGGLFIVCSTDLEGANHGTVFTLTAKGSFESVEKIGDGSEIESLVLGLPPQEEEQNPEPIESVIASRG